MFLFEASATDVGISRNPKAHIEWLREEGQEGESASACLIILPFCFGARRLFQASVFSNSCERKYDLPLIRLAGPIGDQLPSLQGNI